MLVSYLWLSLSLALSASAFPTSDKPFRIRRQDKPFTRQNGFDAIGQNKEFVTLTPDSPCNAGQDACVNNQFAQCVGGKFVLQPCQSGLVCAALPLVNSPGTSITCTTEADRDARIAATGASGDGGGGGAPDNNVGDDGGNNGGSKGGNDDNGGNNNNGGNGNQGGNGGANNNNGDPQTSLCIEPNLVQAFDQDGQQTPAPNQVASLTSTNNFINFCGTVPNLPLTNGKQIADGSCNAAPMGVIASQRNMPASKFQFPTNFDKVRANRAFTVTMAINHLVTGNFVNAQANYFSAPQTVDNNGDIFGHSHIVIERIENYRQTAPLDPSQFIFFRGMNDKAVNGVLSAEVTDGLPVGFYRLASINTAANHQPVVVAVAQHGSLDDVVYFEVTQNGN